jgi:phospholipase D1/2
MTEDVCDTQYEAVIWCFHEVVTFRRAAGSLADTLRAAAVTGRRPIGWNPLICCAFPCWAIWGRVLSIVKLGSNAWRHARADRAAVFLDVASCYGAVRSSLLKARHSVLIAGWDIDSRTPLVGPSGHADDGLPQELGPFLKALAKRTPDLRIRLLLWDFSSLYALEREAFPKAKLNWQNVDLCLDNVLPVGSSQHQKLVIVDDSVAFSGGLDLTIRRWDTSAHAFANPLRCDPAGKPYDPFHDVQIVVEGKAAGELSDLVRERWRCANGNDVQRGQRGEVWPDGLDADFEYVGIGISRTCPPRPDSAGVREIETLFIDMIAAARKSIYIENQYLTSPKIAEALASQLRAFPALEVLIVAPRSHDPWLEALTMRNGRIRFRQIVADAGGDRFRLVYPQVSSKGETKGVTVHSKVMIIDDIILRVGSANLNNRSMGADSECDLVIESVDRDGAIGRVRDRLLAMHCGLPEDEARRAVFERGLIGASRALRSQSHCLADIDDGEPNAEEFAAYLQKVGDPERPIDVGEFIAQAAGADGKAARKHAAASIAVTALVLLLIAAGWAYFTDDARGLVASVAAGSPSGVMTLVYIVAMFVLGSLLMLPVTFLIVGFSAAFGFAAGMGCAAVGTLISAAVGYGIGAYFGKEPVRQFIGGRVLAIRDAIARRGVLAVAAIRVLPIAPFTLVNLAAGATGIGFPAFLAGTFLGMLPGFVVLSVLGRELYVFAADPTLPGLLTVLAVVLLWIASLLLSQHYARQLRAGPS